MSEINKNNLEDFFSNSMEQFDELPSDLVWEGISDRLDEDKRRPIFWWRRFLMMAIPIVAITFATIYFISDADNEVQLVEKITSESIPNSNEVKNQNYKINDAEIIKNKNENLDLTISITSEQDLPTTIQNSSKPTSNSISEKNQNLNITTTNNSSNNNQIRKNNLTIQNEGLNENQDLNYSTNKPSNNQNAESNFNKAIDLNVREKSPINSESSDQEVNQELLNNKPIGNVILNFPRLAITSNLDHTRNIESPPIVIIDNKSNSKYRIGFSGRFANTFVSDNNMFNGNESYGIRQEYYIMDRLAITNAIHFNVQHYDIEPESDPIRPVIVQRYTSRSFDDSGGLQKIESNSEYIDFSLGLKYELNQKLFGFNAFINPSFVGQVYLPQTFSFLDFESNLRYRENKRIVMYLGSANLNFGIEKRLNKNLHLQVSIWGEQSFIPIGLQREKISTLGISTSLLFGN